MLISFVLSLLKAWPVPAVWLGDVLSHFSGMWLVKTQVSGSGSGDVVRVRKAQCQLRQSASKKISQSIILDQILLYILLNFLIQ